jgi:glycosyltransferase involved in cell wall biosynthesis
MVKELTQTVVANDDSGMSSPVVISVVAGHPLRPNMEAELQTLGEMLEGYFERHLVTAERTVSESLRRTFDLIYRVRSSSPDYRAVRYAFRAATQYLDEHSPDVIFNIAQQIPIGFAVALAGHRKQVTTVLRVAGESFRQHELEGTRVGRLRKWLVHWKGVQTAAQLADEVLTLGPMLRTQIVDAGIPSAKVHALPNLFDRRRFPSSPATEGEAKRAVGLDPSRQTVLFVGRVSEMKGADRLLKIVRGVLRRSEDVQFCIVGDGPLLSEFREFPSSRVHLPGCVSYANIPRYYWASDLLIHPSKTEGLPNVILEAIAADVPVMAAPVGEIPRYVRRTSSDPEEYVDYILQGEWEASPCPDWFDWETLRERYLTFFCELASTDGG